MSESNANPLERVAGTGDKLRVRTEGQGPLSKRLRALAQVAASARRKDVGLNVSPSLAQGVDVVKMRRMVAAVGTGVPPALEDGRTAVGDVFHPVRVRPSLVSHPVPFVRTHPGVIALDVLLLTVPAT